MIDYLKQYKFSNDHAILVSFDKISRDYDITFKPNSDSIRVNYLLEKLKSNDNIPIEIYNYFNTSLLNIRKNIEKFDNISVVKKQTGQSINNNNIK